MKMNIGIIIGLIGGGIGLLVGFLAVAMTGSIFGIVFYIVFVGVFAAVFWNVLFKPMMINKRLAQRGISTTAKVMEIKDTGVTVNNSPQIKLTLEVYPPNGEPYLVQTKQLISRLQTSMYQVGSVLSVLIDPDDKNLISLDYGGKGSQSAGSTGGNYDTNSVLTGPWAGMSKTDAERKLYDIDARNKQIFAYGISCRAIVKKYTWLGIYVNGDNPAVEIELEVLPNDKAAFDATVNGVIMEQSIPKFQAGEEIYVKYDPNNTANVTIEHS
jgi:hypothetical protein